jgi:branched-chain amino acid transport system permease protein
LTRAIGSACHSTDRGRFRILLLELLPQIVISGLLVGAVYALSACGLNLIVGVMGIVNMAHGEQIMIGAFITYGVYLLVGGGSPLILFVAIPVTFVIGAALQRYLLEPLMGSPQVGTLLLTFGVSVFLSASGLALFSANYRMAPLFRGSFLVFDLAFPRSKAVTALIAVALTAAIYLFLRAHRVGKAIRATAQNPDAAKACGIDVRRIRVLAFGLGSAMAGAAGAMVSTSYSFNPDIGTVFILKTFAAVVLGGIGSFIGGFVGALLLGLIEGLAAFVATTQLAELAAYVILVVVLLVRPSGLMGARR